MVQTLGESLNGSTDRWFPRKEVPSMRYNKRVNPSDSAKLKNPIISSSVDVLDTNKGTQNRT